MKTMRIIVSILAFLLIVTFITPGPVLAGQSSISKVLEKNTGKRVELVLTSGEKLSGTVAQVTGRTVHLERLTGKEFYDAIIRVDHISAVVIRTRDK